MPKGTWPNGILVAKNGIVWTVGTKSHTLISFDPKISRIKSLYSLTQGRTINTTYMVWTIVEDNDGSIWFSQTGPDPLWHFDPKTGKLEVIHSISSAPMQMKVEAKTGKIWFTTFGGDTIGVIQKVAAKTKGNSLNSANISANDDSNSPVYQIKEFNLGNDSFPSGIFLHGGSIWITETLNGKLLQFKPILDTNGNVVSIAKIFEIPQSIDEHKRLFSTPTDLVVFDSAGSNSNNKSNGSAVWLTEHGTSFITEYHTDTHDVTRFPTSINPHQYTTLPYWIRLGTDGQKPMVQ
jgi:hypothetical protein